jgi:hypothetical protein
VGTAGRRFETDASRRALGVALALAGFVALTALVAPAGPAAGQSGPWETYPATSAVAEADGPYTLVVGDSLTLGELYSVQGLADHVQERIGRSTYVTTTPGGQWITYGWRGQQNGAGLVWEYTDFLDARLAIIALGTNDARIMSRWPHLYSQRQQLEVMNNAVREVRRTAECVLLVNVRERDVLGPGGMVAREAQNVNENMWWVAALDPEGRTFVADWNGHAALHDDWFRAGDVHLTWGGQLEYARFITDVAERISAKRPC